MPYHVSPNPKSKPVGKEVPATPQPKPDDSKWTKVPDPDASAGRAGADEARTAPEDPDVKRVDRAQGDVER